MKFPFFKFEFPFLKFFFPFFKFWGGRREKERGRSAEAPPIHAQRFAASLGNGLIRHNRGDLTEGDLLRTSEGEGGAHSHGRSEANANALDAVGIHVIGVFVELGREHRTERTEVAKANALSIHDGLQHFRLQCVQSSLDVCAVHGASRLNALHNTIETNGRHGGDGSTETVCLRGGVASGASIKENHKAKNFKKWNKKTTMQR